MITGLVTEEYWKRWLHLPLDGRIVRPGNLQVWIKGLTSSEAAPNDIHVQVRVGSDIKEATLALALQGAWTRIDVTLSALDYSGSYLDIAFKTEGFNFLDVRTVSAYQLGDAAAPDIIDVSAGVLGTNDGPDDVFAMELLRNNVSAVRGWKVPRGNVFNHWFHRSLVAGNAYAATFDDLGDYKCVKRRDITRLKVHFLAAADVGVEAHKIRVELTGVNAAPVEGAAQEVAIVDGMTLARYTVTWTLHRADYGEVEFGLRFDGKSDDAPFLEQVYLAGFTMVEDLPNAPVAAIVPDTLNLEHKDPILAAGHTNLWSICHHLWYYGGRQIICSDWRHNLYDGSAYVSTHHCRSNAFDNQDWYGQGAHLSVIARAILFSSSGSKRLRVRMCYYTTSGNTHTKALHFCTTETIDGVHALCDHIDANPRYDDDVGNPNDHQFTEPVDGVDGRPARRVEACFLDIRSADQEEHYDGVNEPPQVLLEGTSANPAEYIIPRYILVEEETLHETEFP